MSCVELIMTLYAALLSRGNSGNSSTAYMKSLLDMEYVEVVVIRCHRNQFSFIYWTYIRSGRMYGLGWPFIGSAPIIYIRKYSY